MSVYIKGLVSIIVPTFFSEKYLEKCLESIVCQTYPDIEVIVCDGDSSDRTPEIISDFAGRYSFLRYIRKKNEGVSASRNRGMEEARGEYIQFVDSDDFLMPDAVETMVKAISSSGADVCIAGFTILKTGEERHPMPGVYEGPGEFAKKLRPYYYYKNNCINTPWNKMYRRNGLNARFPEDLSMGEDLLFNLSVFSETGKIVVIPDIVYEYNNINDQSLAYRYRENGFEIETMLYRAMKKFADEYGGERETVYENYLFGIKTKITALVCKSGLSPEGCRKKLRDWTKNEAVSELVHGHFHKGKKDRILLFLLKHRCALALYLYYKIAA